MNDSNYIDKNGEANLLPSVVCHVDILGWTRLTGKAIKSGEGLIFLRKIRKTLGTAYDRIRKVAIMPNSQLYFEIKTFTDNIVVAIPFRRWRLECEPELITMFDLFMTLQIELAREGFLVRGALAFGDHYMDNDFVYGDALLEAVECEESCNPPRIVLGPSILEKVKTHVEMHGDIRQTPHFHCLFMDTDGKLFINYLSEAFAAFPDGPIFFDLLNSHREVIIKGLNENSSDKGVLMKYQWLAGYHNFVCKHFVDENPMPWDPDEEDYARAVEVNKVSGFIVDHDDVFPHPNHLGVWWEQICCRKSRV